MINEGGEQRQSLTIIKDAVFGLSERDVESAIAEARENSKASMLATLTSGSSTEVLVRVRQIYDKAVALETSGVKQKELVSQLRQEFPGLEGLYWLLRKQPWGYRLGQAVTSAKTLEEEEAKYGPQSSDSGQS